MKANKTQEYSIFLWLTLAIGILIFCSSCASRKVNKSNITETTKTEATTQTVDSSKTVTNADTNIKVVDCTDTDEVVIQPLDNTKEMVVNGRKYNNAILRHFKVKNNITTNQTNKVAQIEQKAVKTQSKVKSEATKKQRDFHSDKEGFSWTRLYIFITIAFFTILFIWCWKNKKDKNTTDA